MPAERAVRPWHGRVYRHLPGGSPYGPLDTRFARRARENHWNRSGEPTLYLATDRAMLIDEFARHIRRERAPDLADDLPARRMFDIDIALDRVYDLTNHAAIAELGIDNAPACFRERVVARATSSFLRDVIGVEAIIAPSNMNPHRTGSRFLIVFLDRLDQPLSEAVTAIASSESFQLARSRISSDPASGAG